MIVTQKAPLRLPVEWRKNIGHNASRRELSKLFRQKRLNTVCEEARCPNIGECFSKKTATFMILGDRCTRRCHFCAVKTARPLPVDDAEADRLVEAIHTMQLEHVVLTSVDRDELPDHGADHFVHCIRAIKDQLPKVNVELLTPDFKGKEELIDRVLAARPDVFGHNIESVERLYRKVRPQSHFSVTSHLLKYAAHKGAFVKSGMMVGLGEYDEEVDETLRYLRSLGVSVVTIGQYLRPSLKHWPVARFVSESSYARWRILGAQLGFLNVYAGPFVRSSYHAKEAHEAALKSA